MRIQSSREDNMEEGPSAPAASHVLHVPSHGEVNSYIVF